MRKLKGVMVATIAAATIVVGAGAASANPVCDNMPGPRDGKAVWYTLLCR